MSVKVHFDEFWTLLPWLTLMIQEEQNHDGKIQDLEFRETQNEAGQSRVCYNVRSNFTDSEKGRSVKDVRSKRRTL